MGAKMESRMREDLFDQYERFSFAYFDAHSSGDMMSRVVNDLFDICEAAHHVPEWIIICGIEIVGAFVILFTISPVLAGVMALITAVFVVVMVRQNFRMREVFADNRRRISDVNSRLQDSLSGMRVVKSFANERAERAKFRASNDRYLDSKVAQYHAMGRYQTTSALMTGVLYATIVVLGGYLVAIGEITAVDMATFALYISLFSTPIETLVNSTESFQKAAAGFQRMVEVLETAPDIQDASDARPLEVSGGAISYRDVCFSYDDADLSESGAAARPVIDHLDLDIHPGEYHRAVVRPWVAESRRRARCSRASTTSRAGRSPSTGRTCAGDAGEPAPRHRPGAAGCLTCSTARCARISPTAAPGRRTPRSRTRRVARTSTTSSRACPTSTTRGGRARQPPLGRAEAARGHRARLPQGPRDPDLGRGHLGAG